MIAPLDSMKYPTIGWYQGSLHYQAELYIIMGKSHKTTIPLYCLTLDNWKGIPLHSCRVIPEISWISGTWTWCFHDINVDNRSPNISWNPKMFETKIPKNQRRFLGLHGWPRMAISIHIHAVDASDWWQQPHLPKTWSPVFQKKTTHPASCILWIKKKRLNKYHPGN